MSCNYLNGTRVCCYDRVATEHTQGVWTSCNECGHDWWCVATERDYLDEPTAWGCSGGCDNGWPSDDLLDDEPLR